jgi:hypothetical protein
MFDFYFFLLWALGQGLKCVVVVVRRRRRPSVPIEFPRKYISLNFNV